MGGLYDKNFVKIAGGLHGLAIEMPTENWRETYSFSSTNVRVMSMPGIFRAVILAESDKELLDMFHIVTDKLSDLKHVKSFQDLPILRQILYTYIEDKIVGEIWRYVVSSIPDIMFDEEPSSLVVIPTPEPTVEMKMDNLYGALVLKLWFIPIGRTEDILYLWGLKDAFSPLTLIENATISEKIKIANIIHSGVFLERVGTTFVMGSWVLVPLEERQKAQEMMDHLFSITSIDFLPGQLIKRNTINFFKNKLEHYLSIVFNRPTSRLLTLMDITAPLGSKLLPADIIALVPRMDLIGFKRVLRVIRTSPVKDIVVVGVES